MKQNKELNEKIKKKIIELNDLFRQLFELDKYSLQRNETWEDISESNLSKSKMKIKLEMKKFPQTTVKEKLQ